MHIHCAQQVAVCDYWGAELLLAQVYFTQLERMYNQSWPRLAQHRRLGQRPTYGSLPFCEMQFQASQRSENNYWHMAGSQEQGAPLFEPHCLQPSSVMLLTAHHLAAVICPASDILEPLCGTWPSCLLRAFDRIFVLGSWQLIMGSGWLRLALPRNHVMGLPVNIDFLGKWQAGPPNLEHSSDASSQKCHLCGAKWM